MSLQALLGYRGTAGLCSGSLVSERYLYHALYVPAGSAGLPRHRGAVQQLSRQRALSISCAVCPCRLCWATEAPRGCAAALSSASAIYIMRCMSLQALLGYRGTTGPSTGPVTEAALGLLRRSDPAETWHKYKIKRVIPHPEYRPPSKYHDIALLETEIPLYNEITATGWGALGYMKEAADTMQKVSLVKFSLEECSELYPERRLQKNGINSTTQMCYGHKTIIRDTCKGDSGGPLQLDTHHPTCMHTLIGVTSYGQECGFQGGAGVYTKVAAYLSWIESVVWP
ncbi:Hemolymph proteinase 18, partial [Operophtera brumata]